MGGSKGSLLTSTPEKLRSVPRMLLNIELREAEPARLLLEPRRGEGVIVGEVAGGVKVAGEVEGGGGVGVGGIVEAAR